uniref:Uncharacterized protein TCIL3000_3_410 n=1 Tax=Trypanosoma congolense (strain IL3000) TaxID=1068625 RepID=G0UJS3_TRYCI|nr:unnamed protein product [Trypanosoma congolense IL3000]
MVGCTTGILFASRTSRRPRVSWLSPALASHQQFDAGIASRHQIDRKNLKKSRRPFANYFRAEYRCSSFHGRTAVRPDGRMSSYDAVKLMADPRRSWAPFWNRAVSAAQTRNKRQDVLEPTPQQFGEDSLDQIIERFLALRFQWDRADGVIAPNLVPRSLQSVTEHCVPYATSELHQMAACGTVFNGMHSPFEASDDDGRQGRSFTPKGNLSCSGVETVPTIVLDAARGPLVSSPGGSSLSVRWKATNREVNSVSEVLRLQQCFDRVPVMGLTPRSVLLLTKAHATAEVENPPLAVALAIAAAEHYHEYNHTECLELLRCLRRVAYVKGLAKVPCSQEGMASLYRDSTRCHMFFAEYVSDAAAFLVEKVWSRLPDQVQRLTRRSLFLDTIDILRLAVEKNGWVMPRNLPNPASSATYASKYLFLRYTVQLDETTMTECVRCMSSKTTPSLPHGLLNNVVMQQPPPPLQHCWSEKAGGTGVAPLVIWLCASFLTRITAEALGDVLRHTEASLKHHLRLVKDYQSAAARGKNTLERLKAETDLQRYLDSISLSRPRHCVYQCIGRRHPKKMRLRVIPLEAFPTIFRHTRLPFESESRQAHLSATRWHGVSDYDDSTFGSVIAQSALAQKHIERASSALDWASMMLVHCTQMAKQALEYSVTSEASHSKGTFSPFSSAQLLPHEIAMSTRFAWCEALVRSRVQNDIDCIFLHIPWCELEGHLKPLSQLVRADGGENAQKVTEVRGALPVTESGRNYNANDSFFFDVLDNLKNDSLAADSGYRHPSPVGHGGAHHNGSTCPEHQGQRSLEVLQSSVERFQEAVAGLIDAQEEYFLVV